MKTKALVESGKVQTGTKVFGTGTLLGVWSWLGRSHVWWRHVAFGKLIGQSQSHTGLQLLVFYISKTSFLKLVLLWSWQFKSRSCGLQSPSNTGRDALLLPAISSCLELLIPHWYCSWFIVNCSPGPSLC